MVVHQIAGRLLRIHTVYTHRVYDVFCVSSLPILSGVVQPLKYAEASKC
jgi:hypothetical protein